MSGHDHDHAPANSGDDPIYRRALWAVIAINGIMFVVELSAGITAKSMALQADSLDFLGDSVT